MENHEQEVVIESTANENEESQNDSNESKVDGLQEVLNKIQAELAEQKDKYLRLFAEFDNFKRRTAKERIDLIKTAGQEIIQDILPVLDDFHRAEKSFESATDIEQLKVGIRLIQDKFTKTLYNKGLKPMESIGADFDADFHEAITEIPAPNEEMKGKVIDEVEKGYFLNDKIIRYAKVVVGK
ncbi:MAG: nucleotide exchange factor GrpE [Chitinophagales bacterium]|nr:nucleotide exchange factor GrpE [Chitinophagales bacterium]